jgi:hypothetical protein
VQHKDRERKNARPDMVLTPVILGIQEVEIRRMAV